MTVFRFFLSKQCTDLATQIVLLGLVQYCGLQLLCSSQWFLLGPFYLHKWQTFSKYLLKASKIIYFSLHYRTQIQIIS